MISFEEAYQFVTTEVPVLPKETVELHLANRRVLAQAVCSDMDMPPFHKAAVDGFACRRADLDKELEVIEVIGAGSVPQKKITTGYCSKIMTGAMVPQGADCVVMVEQTAQTEAGKIIVTNTKTKDNIALRGEDIAKGAQMIEAGTLIQPHHLAVLAAVGAVRVEVYQPVRLTVFSTGDELVEPDENPGPAKIRNSNAIQLINQAREIGCQVTYGGIIPDNEAQSRKMISNAFANSDVLVLSGGISMGDFDYIPQILQELKVDLLFKSVAVQPGRPTVFGRSGNKFVFALPGNPVSSFNIFELLAKPFLYRMMGFAYQPLAIQLPLAADYQRKNTGRHAFVPATINMNGEIVPIDYHGSAHISALVHARALFGVPIGTEKLLKGAMVDVRLI